jgi:hypothetical protein
LLFAAGGGVGVDEAACAQVRGTTSPMIPRIPQSATRRKDRVIVTSAVLLSHMLRVRYQAEALILSSRPVFILSRDEQPAASPASDARGAVPQTPAAGVERRVSRRPPKHARVP